MRVFVVGATGILGRHVVPRLVEARHKVRALIRRQEQDALFHQLEVETLLGDILEERGLQRATAECEAVLHLATAIPRQGDAQDWSMNDRIRREGTANLLKAARENGVRFYIQQSIVMLYGEQRDRKVDEETPLHVAPYIQSALDMEQTVQASPLSWVILRGGYFYGPGTGFNERWESAAKRGELKIPGDGTGKISLIHVVDMARAVVCLVDSPRRGRIYNVVDDGPPMFRELFEYIAARYGTSPLPDGPMIYHSLDCSNVRIKTETDWRPMFPTYRSGLVA